MKPFAFALVIALVGWTSTGRAQEAVPETNAPPRHRVAALTEEQKTQRAQRADEEWNKLTPDAKIRLMRVHDALAEMPLEERRLIHQHIDRFLNMTPAEREQLKKNLDRWKSMTPEERAHAREVYQQKRRELDQKNSATNAPAPSVQSPPVKP